jgi:hypothetical protein
MRVCGARRRCMELCRQNGAARLSLKPLPVDARMGAVSASPFGPRATRVLRPLTEPVPVSARR